MKIAAVRQDILIERVEVDLFFTPPVVALNERNLEKALIAMRNCLRAFRDNNPSPTTTTTSKSDFHPRSWPANPKPSSTPKSSRCPPSPGRGRPSGVRYDASKAFKFLEKLADGEKSMRAICEEPGMPAVRLSSAGSQKTLSLQVFTMRRGLFRCTATWTTRCTSRTRKRTRPRPVCVSTPGAGWQSVWTPKLRQQDRARAHRSDHDDQRQPVGKAHRNRTRRAARADHARPEPRRNRAAAAAGARLIPAGSSSW